ncbi:MAG: 5-methyltetrahydropteroyltriglutamate--homocysteine S-methyltransferase [Rickettsiales bacterium]
MVAAINLGFPSIGAFRELKKAVELYWKGASSVAELMKTAADLRRTHLKAQKDCGLDVLPSGDFSFYDRMLDMSFMFGAIPPRYAPLADKGPFDRYFAMARGCQKEGHDVTAMEMTKWFDTNYHYIVPELIAGQEFSLHNNHTVDIYKEAADAGYKTRPVIIGPVTYLLLSKMRKDDENARFSLLPNLLGAYKEVLQKLKDAGASSVQIDEPCLILDLSDDARQAYKQAYAELATVGLPIDLATYFGSLADNAELAARLPIRSLHIDMTRGADALPEVLRHLSPEQSLSLGVIDGRNIWKANLELAISQVQKAVEALGTGRVMVGPSCSLLHVPVDLSSETELDADLKDCFAFAIQKIEEIKIVARYFNNGADSVAEELAKNAASLKARRSSGRIHNAAVKKRVASLTAKDASRKSTHAKRKLAQQEKLKLPLLPTTTIGSLPQTLDVRERRRAYKDGKISRDEYDAFLKEKTAEAVKYQDELGIDVPVHGEFERNDMVEYFGEQLNGFCFTRYGWVQSYGSRCVKPPIVFGDVFRSAPMTVKWSSFAQSQTKRPMKGMLTGPVTILQWSFVRDDQPRGDTCRQIALAIRDEVVDLEKAGIRIIQIDEPAFREGLPLRKKDKQQYLDWAGECFRISASGVEDATQIHTHMCYCEFNDIIAEIAALDADVISIETSRSAMDLLDAFRQYNYPNDIGPGVYDIHSPRVPSVDEMERLLSKALEFLRPEQVWVNPDCGLKTRAWPETKEALSMMVKAARKVRNNITVCERIA